MHSYLPEIILYNKTIYVLILVLMEDALVQNYDTSLEYRGVVLILVLMEDALVQKKSGRRSKSRKGLNPCFNGRCTRTYLGRRYYRLGDES